jgi:hypothetical protein
VAANASLSEHRDIAGITAMKGAKYCYWAKEALRMYPTCNNPFLGKRHALN